MLREIIPPHPQLASVLLHLMVLDADGRESHLPAGLSPCIILFARGMGGIIEADGSRRIQSRFFLSGPFMTPRHSYSEPGTLSISVMLRPGMLQEAMGLAVTDIMNRYVSMEEIAGEEKVAAFFKLLDEAQSIPDYVALFQDFLLSTLKLKGRKGYGELFIGARHKIFFPMLDLVTYFKVGERQLERRVRATFGVSLRDIRKLARFGLTLPLLSERRLAWGDLTRVAQEAGYYDQAHMHREFVEFSGFSPAQLLQKIACDDPAFWPYRILPEDFKKLFLAE
ncbi:AraC family transcriptional regulator [Herbaspirillum sp. HC18]|nr:AraC family transcriptional regulator [Herbaspirillum sp. HC18]